MAGLKWTAEEEAFITAQCQSGQHPKSIVSLFEKRFGYQRSEESIKTRLGHLKVSFARTFVETGIPINEQVSYDKQISNLKNQNVKVTQKYQEALKTLEVGDRILEHLNSSISSLPKVRQPAFPKKRNEKTAEEALLLLSDIHAGEVVRKDEMRGLNEYNMDICNRRLKALVETITDLAINKLSGYQFQKLNIFMLGDMVSGMIHEELMEVEGNIVTWTTDLAFIMAQMVRELLMIFPVIDITGVVGNHGRLHKKPRFKERYVNWDYICYQFLSLLLAEEIKAGRVKCTFPTSFWTDKEIQGYRWLILHGDNIVSWMGIPWYGIIRATHKLKELQATQNTIFHFLALGHFHNLGTLDMMKGEMIINGSVIGGNEYALGKMYTTSQACQMFAGVHKKHGLTWRYRIDLQDRAIKGQPYLRADISTKSMGELYL